MVSECLICYTSDGKTDKEIFYEIMFNQKTMNYPMLSMAYAYGCKCSDNWAHNKCIINIQKCPTCRKESKPNLYINTRYDYYLKFLLNWLKKDISHIYKLNWYMTNCLIFVIVLLGICGLNEKMIHDIIPPKSNISLCFSIIIGLLFGIPLYVFVVFNDYITKYWLYNPYTNKYDVF